MATGIGRRWHIPLLAPTITYLQKCFWELDMTRVVTGGWSLFEMREFPPFCFQTRDQTKHKVTNWRTFLRFPPKPVATAEVQELIFRLCCNRNDRLGRPSAIARVVSSVRKRCKLERAEY
ncbi:hypothetical protein BJ742DRAFT_270986 [Cladochytrium replicatum]|nr:hypothetical protein BJ742DRAFT_270986 [Cladochytrium replicatum]